MKFYKTHKKLTAVLGIIVALLVASIGLAAAGDTIFNGRMIVTDSYTAVSANVATSTGELYVKGDIEADGNLNIAGTTTISGAVGDLTLAGGVGALLFSDSASSIVLPDNDATALDIGSAGALNLVRFDTADNTETVIVDGTTSALAFHVDVGTAKFDEGVTFEGNLTLQSAEVISNAVNGVVQIAGAGQTNNENITFDFETTANAVEIGSGTGVTVLDTNLIDIRGDVVSGRRSNIASGASITPTIPDDCGAVLFVSTDNGVVNLPDAASANLGCCFTMTNSGADGAAKISFSPHSSDGIDGSCIGEGPAFVEFTGTADKDIINTKATANKGDSATICSDGTAGWYVTSCLGVWASE